MEPLIARANLRPTLLRFLLVGLQLAVQLLQLFDQAVEIVADGGERLLRLRFLSRADLQALVPREEFQRQALELIEHVAEELRELVLSRRNSSSAICADSMPPAGSCRSTDTVTRPLRESWLAAAPAVRRKGSASLYDT